MEFTLAKLNCIALQEHLTLLKDLSDAMFMYTRPPVFPTPLGNHLRHDLDHYLSFLRGLSEHKIDYESRARDVEIETSRTYAMEVIQSIIHDLEGLRLDPATPLNVRIEQGEHHEVVCSTVNRELDFLLSHTLHHQAIIAMIVRDKGETISSDYGVAPSTLRHIRQGPCAQ